MSFIKVKDPRKREELIRDFIETRKRIRDNFVARKVGESEYQTGLTKLFKPVTETQKATAKEITDAQKATAEKFTSELLPIKEGIEGLPTKEDISKIPLKVFNQIFPELKYKESDIMNLGTIAVNALIEAFSKDGIDRTYGIYAKDKRFYMGNKRIDVKDNDIIINNADESGTNVKFDGTPGLWKLITEKNIPRQEEFKKELLRYYNEEETEDKDEDDPQPSTSGTGLKILPSDPNALIDRFDLLFSSKKAGHTGVRNEIVSILDELKRQGVLKTNEYKKLNSLIKK